MSHASELYPLQVLQLSADSTNFRRFGVGMGKSQANMTGAKTLMGVLFMCSVKSQHLCSLNSSQDKFSYGQL